jgi:hypothetical protein
MFGKLIAITSHWKSLEVYMVKRYPTAKLPIAGMIIMNLAGMLYIRTFTRVPLFSFGKKEGKLGEWKF